MTRLEECNSKVKLIRKELLNSQRTAVVIKKQSNFSWITSGGRGFIGLASENSCASIVVTKEQVFLVANNIESPRIMTEELPTGFAESITIDWPEDSTLDTLLSEKFSPYTTDIELESWFKSTRLILNPSEQERYLSIGKRTASILEESCMQIETRMTEFEVAGIVSSALWKQGIEPITLLVAADRRSQYVRHYVPTSATIHQGVIVSICARSKGLIVSATRIVAFDNTFAANYDALLNVEQAMWEATTPNSTLLSVLERTKTAYAENGLAEEWKNHHQGGLTGYMAREIRVDAFTTECVKPQQAYAWNPSAAGIKCEDTILLAADSLEIVTPVSSIWPSVQKGNMVRPDILRKF